MAKGQRRSNRELKKPKKSAALVEFVFDRFLSRRHARVRSDRGGEHFLSNVSEFEAAEWRT